MTRHHHRHDTSAPLWHGTKASSHAGQTGGAWLPFGMQSSSQNQQLSQVVRERRWAERQGENTACCHTHAWRSWSERGDCRTTECTSRKLLMTDTCPLVCFVVLQLNVSTQPCHWHHKARQSLFFLLSALIKGWD